MKSPAHDLALYLSALGGIGTFASANGWAIALGSEPAAPDTTVTFYDASVGAVDTDELDLDRAAVQVRVRSRNYADAYARAEAVRDALILPTRLVTDESAFVGIFMSSGISSLGRDENDRFVLVATYDCIREIQRS